MATHLVIPEKLCTRCLKKKPASLDFFSKHTQTKNGLHSWCRVCHKEYSKLQREYNPFWILLAKKKHFCTEHGLPFDLTMEYLQSLPSTTCPVLGIPIYFNKGKGVPVYDSCSLDRLIPELGYTQGNVVFMSMKANLIKQNATSEEVQKVAAWMKENSL